MSRAVEVRTVVVPIDLSPLSGAAFESAVGVAEMLGAERIHLVHVIRDVTRWMRELSPGPPVGPLASLERIVDLAEARLARFVPSNPDLEVTREARIGGPAQEIVAAIEESNGDLAVIASQQRSGVGRWVLGSVAHAVIRAAGRPVLVVGESHRWRRPKKILAAIDLSPVSERVLIHAVAFAKAARAQVTALSAYDLLWIPTTSQASVPLPLDDTDRRALEVRHREAVQAMVDRVADPDVPMSSTVTGGQPPAKVILQQAEQLGADLIVVGASGHSAWERIFLGSTATKVASSAPCPVLVVPPLHKADS